MKLGNIWNDFDLFVEKCLSIGTNNTKERIKKLLLDFQDNRFEGDWKLLLKNIVYIFVYDNRVAKSFDYSREFLLMNQEIFKQIDDDSRELTAGLYEKLKMTYKTINENGDIQYWGATNKFYEQIDKIYLSKTLSTNKILTAEIKGHTIRNEKDYFSVTVDSNIILITYENNKYSNSLNTKTNKKVQISKYPEIIHFINAKYYNLYIDKLSYNQFKYLVQSFCDIKNLLVPTNNNGYLKSIEASQYLNSLTECNKYFSAADKRFENIRFTYKMSNYNKFEIVREGDDLIAKNIAATENAWGEARSANKSRKGNIRTPK